LEKSLVNNYLFCTGIAIFLQNTIAGKHEQARKFRLTMQVANHDAGLLACDKHVMFN